MSEQLNFPENYEQPSIANGVMHGPYPQTEAHPWDQSNGHDQAVDEAFTSGRIGTEQRDAMLEGPVASSMLDDSEEAIRIEDEANEETHLKELDHEDALKENEARDEVAVYIQKHGKPQSYDWYLERSGDPEEALGRALEDDATPPDAEDEFRQQLEEEDTEDPLAGDVDRWVHPDETRSDAQIEHDEKYKVEPY